jgi:glycerol-3-phosphate acyltransferase PlsY
MAEFLTATLIGYVAGSIPFGLLLVAASGMGDVRKIGSGNIGATNVLRTGNKRLAAATLLLDAGKGAFTVIAAGYFIGADFAPVAGFFALLGHCYPAWLKFKGGKGVATFLGALVALSWLAGLAVAATWLATAFAFRYSSLAALVAIGLSPILSYVLTQDIMISGFCALSSLLIFWKHRSNIRRLTSGQEPKIGQKDK